MRLRLLHAFVLAGALAALAAPAHAQSDFAISITATSIEELMNVTVTSVSRKPERLNQAPAAIHVLTNEDLRRLGSRTTPDALRYVPGMEVARIDASKYAVSARGFNSRTASKLLVLADGRALYDPLFSGTFWEFRELMLEDVDRIEVIRGPGGTQFGANAVNGVISILSKRSELTQGTLLVGAVGTEERAYVAMRHGTKVSEDAFARVYGMFYNRDEGWRRGPEKDDWQLGRVGFRSDWYATAEDTLTLQGDYFRGEAGEITAAAPGSIDAEFEGGNILARYGRNFGAGGQLWAQAYYDRTVYDTLTLNQRRDTVEVDVQHQFQVGESHDIVAGAGYRASHDAIPTNPPGIVRPKHETIDLASAFLQDDIEIVEDTLRLSLGAKLEYHEYTQWELQPSARIALTPSRDHLIWAAFSRAIRAPSRLESDIVTPTLIGSADFESENLLAFELGYRTRPAPGLYIDVATFLHEYEDLITQEPRGGGLVQLDNDMHGETYGAEVAARWRPLDWWQLHGAYSFLRIQLHRDPESRDPRAELAEGRDPRHWFAIRSMFDLPYDLELDVGVRYMDHLSFPKVRSYVVADVRLGWRPRENLDLSVIAHDLGDDKHPEFASPNGSEVEHGVYFRVMWRF